MSLFLFLPSHSFRFLYFSTCFSPASVYISSTWLNRMIFRTAVNVPWENVRLVFVKIKIIMMWKNATKQTSKLLSIFSCYWWSNSNTFQMSEWNEHTLYFIKSVLRICTFGVWIWMIRMYTLETQSFIFKHIHVQPMLKRIM